MLWNTSVIPKDLIGQVSDSTGDSRTEPYQTHVGHFKLRCTKHIVYVYIYTHNVHIVDLYIQRYI
jgi:hypothetical protein